MAEPSWTAQLDQSLAGLRDMAKLLWGYYTALRDEGFDREPALQIVIAWQTTLQTSGSDTDDAEEPPE